MSSKKCILVTGSPRSGTTWVGQIISHAPFVRYVHEPFNITRNQCACGVDVKYWFYYLSSNNFHKYDKHLRHVLYPAYSRVGLLNLYREVVRSRRVRPLLKYLQSHFPHKVLMKDPLAVFSAEALARRFDMDVVVLIRHPAAIVSSYKALKWTHPFSHFLLQPELMEGPLAPFQAEIEDFARHEYDIIDQAALVWKLVYHVITIYQKTHTDWIFIRYEELASDPIAGFQDLFKRLGLPFSDHIGSLIKDYELRAEFSDTTQPYALHQKPTRMISKWRRHLMPDDIERIRTRVEDVSSAFFSQEEWCMFLAALSGCTEVVLRQFV